MGREQKYLQQAYTDPNEPGLKPLMHNVPKWSFWDIMY